MSDSQFSDSREYQIKLLAYMVHNHDFADLASHALKDEHFSDKALQWYYDTLATAPIKLTPALLKEELMKAAKAKAISKDEIPKYVEYYEFLKQRPVPAEEEYIKADLGKFVRTQAVKSALMESWDLAKAEQWDTIVENLSQAVNEGVDILDMGYFYFKKTQDRVNSRSSAGVEEKLPTGIPDLDTFLYGGIKPKQLAMVAGGTGRGKSIMLEWLAKVAVMLGKKVVYYTLELSDSEVANRFDALFSQVKINELKLYDNEVFTAINPLAARFKEHLVIKEYPADTATVSTLKAHIGQLNSIGFYPDLVIVDYLDLLKPHRTYNSQHEELDAITKALHGFAKELDTRVWTATQLNRSGLVMETPDESAIAGAVSKLYTVDLALFLAATPEEREEQEMRLIIAKNRNGPCPRTVKIGTDYARMTFYKPLITTALSQGGISGQDDTDEQDQNDGELAGAEADGDMFILQ